MDSQSLPVSKKRCMIRLILIVLLLLTSLLTVIKAPTYNLWKLAIAAAEFAWVFIAITIVVLLSGFLAQRYTTTGTVLGLIAIVLFLSPFFRAYDVASHLPKAMDKALGDQSDTTPLNLSVIFSGYKEAPVAYKSLPYCGNLHLDFYPAIHPGNHPCVVVVHGGSWSSGNSQDLPELNTYLANHGYHVAAINYRLAPQNICPAPVEDVYQAIDYLRAHAEELRIDTNNFVLMGRSAGAQIALLAAYKQHVQGLKGVVDFYGPADMVWGYSLPASPLVMDSRKVMENYLGGTYSAVPNNYAASSPVEFVNSNTVPTLIIHGEHDVLVAYEHSIRLEKKLQDNGIKHFFLSLPWATHGFDYNLKGPGGQLSTYSVLRFLQNICYEQQS